MTFSSVIWFASLLLFCPWSHREIPSYLVSGLLSYEGGYLSFQRVSWSGGLRLRPDSPFLSDLSEVPFPGSSFLCKEHSSGWLYQDSASGSNSIPYLPDLTTVSTVSVCCIRIPHKKRRYTYKSVGRGYLCICTCFPSMVPTLTELWCYLETWSQCSSTDQSTAKQASWFL